MNIHISSKIRQLRKAKNMSQEELAAPAGCQFSGCQQMGDRGRHAGYYPDSRHRLPFRCVH